METREMQWIKALLRLWGSVDPLSDSFAHFLLDVLLGVYTKLIWTLLAISVTLDYVQILRHPLLIEGNQEVCDAECIVVSRSMEQVMTIVVHKLCDLKRLLQLDTLQDWLQLCDVKGWQSLKDLLLLGLKGVLWDDTTLLIWATSHLHVIFLFKEHIAAFFGTFSIVIDGKDRLTCVVRGVPKSSRVWSNRACLYLLNVIVVLSGWLVWVTSIGGLLVSWAEAWWLSLWATRPLVWVLWWWRACSSWAGSLCTLQHNLPVLVRLRCLSDRLCTCITSRDQGLGRGCLIFNTCSWCRSCRSRCRYRCIIWLVAWCCLWSIFERSQTHS